MPWNRHRSRRNVDAMERAVQSDLAAGVRLERAKRQAAELKELADRARDSRLRNHYGEAIAESFKPRGKKSRSWRWHS